ncbi:MAG TPA: thermonuclease family protein, partial [Chloroflexia bacterium]|nr:thermonuclease family protein [Chloroflexia bacterium]
MRRTRVYRSAILLVLATSVLALGLLTAGEPYTVQPAQAEQSAQGMQTVSRLFPETNQSVRGKFLQYWLVHGGLAQQGYPISREMAEQSDTDGKTYTVQYFERAVFEYHPEYQPPNDVLLSLLGVFRYHQKYPRPAGAPGQVPNTSPGSVVFPETGKRLGGVFLDYWRSHGGLPQQGFPISDEFVERSDLNGREYRVQYFQRAVFELHPENQPPYNVLLSQLGTFRYRSQYEGPRARPVRPPVVPVPSAGWEESKVVGVLDGDTVTVTLNGQQKTVRYLLIDAPSVANPAECYALEALNANRAMVGGKTLYLEKDVSDTDASGRLLRYAFTLESLVNSEMVRGGFARVVSSPPNTRYEALLGDLQRDAREGARGLWGPPCGRTATVTPTPTGSAGPPTRTATSAVVEPTRPRTTPGPPTIVIPPPPPTPTARPNDKPTAIQTVAAATAWTTFTPIATATIATATAPTTFTPVVTATRQPTSTSPPPTATVAVAPTAA